MEYLRKVNTTLCTHYTVSEES